MDSELESEEKTIQKPDLRRRIRLSLWLLFLLIIIIGGRVYLVRWPTEGPTWHGLTVGESTTDDVIAALGEPAWTSTERTTEPVYHYEEWIDNNWGHPIIYFRDNQVIRIRVASGQDITLLTFVKQYGKPDLIADEVMINTHSPVTTKGVYWSDEGIYVSTLSPESPAPLVTYFRPCPIFDRFCILAEQLNFSGPAPPGKDEWGIMSPLPTPTLTPTPGRAIFIPD